MPYLKQKKILFVLPVLISLLLLFSYGCSNKFKGLDLSMYHYRDTKDLVKFVYNASLILKKRGLKGLSYFKKNRSLFNTPDYYLYIYDMNGTNLFHAGMPRLEGKNLKNAMDKNGKKVFYLILQALKDKNNPHGWVHYSWWEPGKFFPVPKSSCHFKVVTPEGQELFLGAGLNYPHEEPEFIRIIVDDAAELIDKEGRKALPVISHPTSQYNFRDVRVFAFYPDGKILISPTVDNTYARKNFIDSTDEVNNKPFVTALEKLKTAKSAFQVFMVKNRYRRDLIKKTLYIRKAHLDGQEIFVAAITGLPEPPY